MSNKVKIKAVGTCKHPLENPKTSQKYMVKFVVVEEELIPLLSRKAAEKMTLITINYDKFESVSGVVKETGTLSYKIFLMCSVNILALYLALCN